MVERTVNERKDYGYILGGTLSFQIHKEILMRSAWKNKFLPIKDQQKKPCECFRSRNLIFLSGVFSLCLTPSTAVKIRPKFLNMKLFDQNQQPLKSVKPFERILRALFISQCPYKFSSFLDLSMQIPEKRIETVGNNVKTVGTCQKHC